MTIPSEPVYFRNVGCLTDSRSWLTFCTAALRSTNVSRRKLGVVGDSSRSSSAEVVQDGFIGEVLVLCMTKTKFGDWTLRDKTSLPTTLAPTVFHGSKVESQFFLWVESQFFLVDGKLNSRVLTFVPFPNECRLPTFRLLVTNSVTRCNLPPKFGPSPRVWGLRHIDGRGKMNVRTEIAERYTNES